MRSSGFLTPGMKSAQLLLNTLLFPEQEYQGEVLSPELPLLPALTLGVMQCLRKHRNPHTKHLPSSGVQLQLSPAAGRV